MHLHVKTLVVTRFKIGYLHLAVNRVAKGKEKEKKERDEREESKTEALAYG